MFAVSPDDDWDDVIFPETTAALSRKHRGIFMVNDNLESTCVRLLSPLTLPDDASSSSSSYVSNHSKLFVDQEWDNRPRGKITRIEPSRSNHSRTSSVDVDWESDLQLPPRLERSLPRRRPDALLEKLNDSSRKTVSFQPRHVDMEHNRGLVNEKDDTGDDDNQRDNDDEDGKDDDNFDDIEFPDDMRTLSTRRERKLARSAIVQRHNASRKEDEGNICDGLELPSDDVFQVSRSSKRPTTRLPRATKVPLPERRGAPLSIPQTMSFLPVARRLEPCMPPQPKPFFRTAISGPEPRRQREPTRTTLLSQPKSGLVFGSGRELDAFDNLPEWRGFKQRQQNKTTHNGPSLRPLPRKKPEPAVDPLRPWRTNMRMPTLIRPDDKPVIQVRANDMNYDPKRCLWQGNERSVARFDHEPLPSRTRRPALIRHKAKTPCSSKYAEVVVGNMVFNVAEMRWVKQAEQFSNVSHDKNPGVNALDTIEDLVIDENQMYTSLSTTGRGPRQGLLEFKISPDFARQMVDEEKVHNAMMKAWNLGEEEPVTKRQGHGWLPSYAYLVTNPRR